MGTSGHVKVQTPQPGIGDLQRTGHCHLCPSVSSWVEVTVISLNSAPFHHHTFVHAVNQSPLPLFHSSCSFKTCSSALTQHTKNRARSSPLSTQTTKHRQESSQRRGSLRSVCWVWILWLPFTSSVTLGKLPPSCEPQFPHHPPTSLCSDEDELSVVKCSG